MRVLVIAAHPDDEVYGMGGTIAKLTSKGHEVHILIVTDGCTAQYRDYENLPEIIERKKEESKKANALIGVKQVHFGNLPDMQLDVIPHIELNEVIENVIERVRPKEVYTHFYGDVNLDHQMVYKSTLVAVRPVPDQCVKRLYAYSVPSATEWSPQMIETSFTANVFSNIEDFELQKELAIATYQTELRNYPHPRSIKSIKALDLAVGLQCGMQSSESFILLRSLS